MNDNIEKGDIVKLTRISEYNKQFLDKSTNYCVTQTLPYQQTVLVMSGELEHEVRMCDCEIVDKRFKLTGCLPQPEYPNQTYEYMKELFNPIHIMDKNIKNDYTKQYLSSEYEEVQEKNYIQQDIYKKDGISEEIIVEDEEVLYIGDLPVDQNLTGEEAEKIQDKSKHIVSKCIEKLMEKI